MKTVVFGEIDIFFNDKVGILLTNKKAIKTVKYGTINLISKLILRSESSKKRGVNINKPPAGDGIPSK